MVRKLLPIPNYLTNKYADDLGEGLPTVVHNIDSVTYLRIVVSGIRPRRSALRNTALYALDIGFQYKLIVYFYYIPIKTKTIIFTRIK